MAIAASLGIDPDAAFGKCFRVWRWFDKHTIDGDARGVTSASLDAHVGATGFTQAMVSVGWLIITESGLKLPNFDRHNGQTAKKRALTAKRMSTLRKRGDAQRDAGSVTNGAPREEKRRVSSSQTSCDKEGKVLPPRKQKPRQRDELWDAVVAVTQADPKTSASHVGKVCRSLREAEPPYTPAEVQQLATLLSGRGFSLPLSLSTVERNIGWTRAAPQAALAGDAIVSEEERHKRILAQRQEADRAKEEARNGRG